MYTIYTHSERALWWLVIIIILSDHPVGNFLSITRVVAIRPGRQRQNKPHAGVHQWHTGGAREERGCSAAWNAAQTSVTSAVLSQKILLATFYRTTQFYIFLKQNGNGRIQNIKFSNDQNSGLIWLSLIILSEHLMNSTWLSTLVFSF